MRAEPLKIINDRYRLLAGSGEMKMIIYELFAGFCGRESETGDVRDLYVESTRGSERYCGLSGVHETRSMYVR